jgi:hypothetical protein
VKFRLFIAITLLCIWVIWSFGVAEIPKENAAKDMNTPRDTSTGRVMTMTTLMCLCVAFMLFKNKGSVLVPQRHTFHSVMVPLQIFLGLFESDFPEKWSRTERKKSLRFKNEKETFSDLEGFFFSFSPFFVNLSKCWL